MFLSLKRDESQITRYVNHSELQRRSAWKLLSRIQFRGDETVLDIGCGDGRNAAWIACLVRNGKVVGIDPCNSMISWAKRQYHPSEFPNLKFEIAEFETAHSVDVDKESCDMVTSFFSLHMAGDKLKALNNVFSFLKPKGRFVCVTPPFHTNKEHEQAINTAVSSSKWKGYFTNFVSIFQLIDLQQYKSVIAEAGFNLLEGQYQRSVDPFVNTQEYINWFKGTMPHVLYLPEDKHDEFVEDCLQTYLTLRPDAIAKDGTLYFFWGRFEFIAYKN